jgi:hypothetical protein
VHRLAAAGCEELVHLGCSDGGGQELMAKGKAAPECFELELGGIGRGGLPAIWPVDPPRWACLPWRAGPQRLVPRAGPSGPQVRAARAVADRERQPGNRPAGSWAAPLTQVSLAQVVRDVRAPGCSRWLAVKVVAWLCLPKLRPFER